MRKPPPQPSPGEAMTSGRDKSAGLPVHSQATAGLLFGLWLALVPVKFGNPVIFGHLLTAPQSFSELLLGAWPVAWTLGALGVIAAATTLVWACPSIARRRRAQRSQLPHWVSAALLIWFGWTLLSATRTVDPKLTHPTLIQFTGCILCFAAGLFGLSNLRDWRPVWAGLIVGMAIILGTALDQHFGGLEATRRWFEQQSGEIRARLDTPEFRQKILSNRVFGPFVYPNALAGALLLLFPASLTGILKLGRSRVFKWVLGGLLSAASLGALYWSGSKSGWLIALLMATLALWRLHASAPFKLALLVGMLGLGIGAFYGKHSGYFDKGASSLSARFDYWRAVAQMIRARPVLGYGPGTFQRQYAVLKRPESEMAKLAHNDYLEQGCDSGFPAMGAFTVFLFGSVFWLYRRRNLSGPHFALWLGAFAYVIQGLTEFALYIPGLAWPFFLFLGWLWGASPELVEESPLSPSKKGTHSNEFDTPSSPS